MKHIFVLLPLFMLIMIAPGCKKDKKEEPAPTPSPTATTTTFELALVDFTAYAPAVVNPKIVALSPAGDTIVPLQNITLWDATSFADDPSVTDSAACAAYTAIPSATVSYALLNDGSNFVVNLYEGSTLKVTIHVTYSSVWGGYGKMCPSNYHRVVAGW